LHLVIAYSHLKMELKIAILVLCITLCYSITTKAPSTAPTVRPSVEPTTFKPTFAPSEGPSLHPTASPSHTPTTAVPSHSPTLDPTAKPTTFPSVAPSEKPTESPTADPTARPSEHPTAEPTAEPTPRPTAVNFVSLTKGGVYVGTDATDYFDISATTDVIITGNGGSDRYIVKLAPGAHIVITDFKSDDDIIDLSNLDGMYGLKFLEIIPETDALAISLPNGQLITLLGLTEEEFNTDDFVWARNAQASPNKNACGLCFFIVCVVLIYGFYYQVYKAYTVHKQLQQAALQEGSSEESNPLHHIA